MPTPHLFLRAKQQDQAIQQIIDVYQTYLGRGAGSGEVSMWVGDFQAGWTEANLVGAVVLSGEYQNRVGASNSQFVGALYRGMLGRRLQITFNRNDPLGWAAACS